MRSRQGSAVELARTVKELLRPGGVALLANHSSWFTDALQAALAAGAAAAGLSHRTLPTYAEAVFTELRREE